MMCDTHQHILSSAHTAIVLPDDDVHYGVTGDYANCTHYFPRQPNSYAVCLNNASGLNRGEINAANLQQGVMKRLMSNPKFAQLKISLARFIADLD